MANRPGSIVLEPFARSIRYSEGAREIRIGVIVPFDFGLDWEYWRYLPANVSLCFTRTRYVPVGVGVHMAEDISCPSAAAAATRELSAAAPDATLYACSSGSFVHGPTGERSLRACMVHAGARRAVTTSGAMLDALRAVGARRIALATPYTARLTERLVSFLAEAGYDVVSAHYLGLEDGIESVSQATIAELVRESVVPTADTVFVACTGLHTHGILAALERDTARVVLTANQVSLWAALREAGALSGDRHLTRDEILGGADPMARSTGLLLADTMAASTA